MYQINAKNDEEEEFVGVGTNSFIKKEIVDASLSAVNKARETDPSTVFGIWDLRYFEI